MNRISRRQLLTQYGSATASVLTMAALPRWSWAFPLSLPPGIQLYTVNSYIQQDAVNALKQVAAIGYKEVETAGFGSLRTASEFRKVLEDNGLKCPSAHLDFDLKNLQKTFDDANNLGCTYATSSVPRRMIMSNQGPLPPNLPPGDQQAIVQQRMHQIFTTMTPDEFKKLADVLNLVGAAAKKAGLKYASHNHSMEFSMMDGKPGYDYLIAHTDPDLVKFEIDCGWTTIAGYQPVDYLNRYPGRFKMIHMSDYLPLKQGVAVDGVPPGTEVGTGIVPYKAILAEAKGRGIEHVFVEQAGPFPRMSQMEAAKADYNFIKSILG